MPALERRLREALQEVMVCHEKLVCSFFNSGTQFTLAVTAPKAHLLPSLI